MILRLLLAILWLSASAFAQTSPPPTNETPAPSSAPSPSPVLSPSPTPTPLFLTIISVAKDTTSTLFFILTAVLALLTYLQARRTIFTPFRTEAFKLQLKAFEDILVFFEKHPTTSIDEEFDFETIVNLNAVKLLDSYMLHFFHSEVDPEALRKNREPLFSKLVGAAITHDYAEKHFAMPQHVRPEQQEKSDEHPTNPAIILAKWSEYKHGIIDYSKRFNEASERLRRFKVSPLLPRKLKDRIDDFEKIVTKNLFTVGEVLTDIAKELPEKYPTLDSLKRANLSWIWNSYNDKREPLAETQDAILLFLNDYLQIDRLLSKKA